MRGPEQGRMRPCSPPHAAGASLLHIYLNNVASEISATSLDAGNRTIQIR